MAESVPVLRLRQTVVFVVDDEELIATSLAIILNHAGYDAHAFSTGQEAVDSLAKLQPDLLIADVFMPGMNGVRVAILIRAKWPQCKILLLSGHADTMDLLEAARTQGHEFEVLAKPVHPRDLLAKIRSQS